MSAASSNSEDGRRAELEAADWVVRLDRGLSGPELDEYSAWLAADPSHGQWLARKKREWASLDVLADWRPEHSTEPNPDLLARPRRRRWTAWTPLGLAAALVLGVSLWFVTNARSLPPAEAPVVAGACERRVLKDGSVVQLNRGAVLEVDYGPAQRRVVLRQGEAHFQVAKDAHRPFIVRAGGVQVRAVGTAFDVRMATADVEILVTEGRVQVQPSAKRDVELKPALVSAGECARVSLAESRPTVEVTSVTPEQMVQRLGWQSRWMHFEGRPLAEIVAEFNRFNRTQLVIADAELNGVSIVASFRPENVEAFVRLLEQTAGVRAERTGDTVTLRRR
ncbi:FecR domain-containing protein [Opitutus sp. ER46]|uniref:FecR family protein n=1 Tax=Opitutus sp. ER46 TaxID=2161864 RepID=UPI000D2F86D7|nr:FecR domain-containing protein [Opitutus sp. ER46]PTX92276.1 hypothetical protein DB354_13075 [Opitutus sp. ER46]